LQDRGNALETTGGSDPRTYSKVHGKPVLIDFERSVIQPGDIVAASSASIIPRRTSQWRARIKRFFLHGGAGGRAAEQCDRFVAAARQSSPKPRILVIGGGTRGIGTEALYDAEDLELILFDVYPAAEALFVADSHAIPLADGSIDGVWIQYVLEHVLDPHRVVGEIVRVLRAEGVVYSETPFLQQVHEFAYDFSRFTHSGHRWLFSGFEEISSGVAMGQGPQLLWSIEHLARGLFRSLAIGKLVKLAFFWLQYIDRFVPDQYRYATASSFYFLGRKSTRALAPHEIVSYYRGVKPR
jgi:SAM-dependent methyltransferase